MFVRYFLRYNQVVFFSFWNEDKLFVLHNTTAHSNQYACTTENSKLTYKSQQYTNTGPNRRIAECNSRRSGAQAILEEWRHFFAKHWENSTMLGTNIIALKFKYLGCNAQQHHNDARVQNDVVYGDRIVRISHRFVHHRVRARVRMMMPI